MGGGVGTATIHDTVTTLIHPSNEDDSSNTTACLEISIVRCVLCELAILDERVGGSKMLFT